MWWVRSACAAWKRQIKNAGSKISSSVSNHVRSRSRVGNHNKVAAISNVHPNNLVANPVLHKEVRLPIVHRSKVAVSSNRAATSPVSNKDLTNPTIIPIVRRSRRRNRWEVDGGG